MKKYLTVFSLSFQNEFTYRVNFILWRVRNVLRVLMTFFLWHSVFSSNKMAFGYTGQQMFAYVFLVLIITSFVMSAPSNDNIGGEIGGGNLNNFLVKPIGYLKYWLTRDWASKLLNLLFAGVEITLLWFLLRPAIAFTSSIPQLLVGLLLCLMASLIYFVVTKLAISVSFWAPENTWGLMFVILVFMETLAGGIFPLDVLSAPVNNLLLLTPFPYLIYYPIAVLVGKLSLSHSFFIFILSVLQLIFYSLILKFVWKKGLKNYGAYGG